MTRTLLRVAKWAVVGLAALVGLVVFTEATVMLDGPGRPRPSR